MSSALKYTCDRCGVSDVPWNEIYHVTFHFAAGQLREDGFAKNRRDDVNKDFCQNCFDGVIDATMLKPLARK